MSYAPRPNEFIPYLPERIAAKRRAEAKRRGILRRIFDAIVESRQKHAERELARFVERTGGRLTDDIERRMTEHLTRGDWN